MDMLKPTLSLSFNDTLGVRGNSTKTKNGSDHGKSSVQSKDSENENVSNDSLVAPVNEKDEGNRLKNLRVKVSKIEKFRNKPDLSSCKRTSDGERRIGIASMNRNRSRLTDHILNNIKRNAVGSIKEEGTNENTPPENGPLRIAEMKQIVSPSVIQSAIEELLKDHTPTAGDDSNLKAAFNSFTRRIGIIRDDSNCMFANEKLKPGSIIRRPFDEDDVLVRLATPSDDVDIANLRLSVFSDVSPDIQSQFCYRSCQAIAARRMRGACCIVATSSRIINVATGSQANSIVGTAECSFHEFFGTQLGLRRPANSILYVTEVAVNPSVRRQGVASKLLRAVDTFAKDRGIESIYLHVDVCNYGAIRLYDKCGYKKVSSDHPIYLEFTTSLNLHPGATKGRNHFLLCRNLTSDLTWLGDRHNHYQNRELVGTLGFEIPV